MSTPLTSQHCRALEGQLAMTPAQIAQHLLLVPGWAFSHGAIERQFAFANYTQTLAFVNSTATLAEREDHHPEMRFGYNRCTVRFDTHSVGGISLNDFICAAHVQAGFDAATRVASA